MIPFNNNPLARIPQVDVKLELDDPPTREEIDQESHNAAEDGQVIWH